MTWEKVYLRDIADTCLGKMLDQNKNKGDYCQYLANVNVRWGAFDLSDLPLMRFEANEQERYGLKYGDIVICEGGEPGRCAIWKNQIPNMKIQKALHRVRVHPDMDYRYVYYWFLWAGRRGALEQYFTGATIKHMPGQKLKSVIIDKPPLETQHRIADILSAYDDLIEVNQKQIRLLEEAARRLYREWFVALRFPGHEDTPIIDGIPAGWSKTHISEICQMVSGGTPSTKVESYYSNGSIPWVTPTDITQNKALFFLDTEKKITEDGLHHSSAKMVPAGTILMTSRASVGYFGMCDFEVCTNQGFISCIPNQSNLQMFLLFNLKNRIGEIRQKAGGSTYLEIRKTTLGTFDILIPSAPILQLFQNITQSIFQKERSLLKTNKLLQEARDRLLPKLMNGEIEV